jgi:asparagine synthase (glutamine-hydrolysing)
MNRAVQHRGPDDFGLFMDSNHNAGLGHRRLSIIDLSGGKQPMSNEDGSLWITFNGEIYNYQDIKKQLTDHHNFKTKSDTEVILHLYEEKGEECLKYLRGMFAFAIYDQSNKEKFVFASEIKSILALNPELNQLNPEALYEYFTLRIITPPRSMFLKIKKLPPGHFLVFQNGKTKIEQYWDLKYEPKFKMDLPDILTELEKKLENTVRYHLVSDVPVGAFLSGGMDSSLVVAMMRKHATGSIKTFSGDVSYENFSEIPFARMVADKYHTDHHELKIYPSLIRSLPDLVWHLDEPSDPLSVCMFHISALARKEVKVVLGGDGGDELFGGYDRYYGNVLVRYYSSLPDNLRKHVLGKVIQLMPEDFWYRSYSHRLRWMHQMSFFDGAERYAKSLGYFYFSDGFKRSLYSERLLDSVHAFDPEASIKRHFNSDSAKELVDKMLHTDSMTRMPDHPNMILDRMTMAHGLEARSPFLDHKLAEFCARIPPKFKVRGFQRRFIEVQLAKKYLPPALIKKKKQGFSSALPYILADEFKLLYKIFLKDSSLVRDEYLNKAAIDLLLQEHLSHKMDHGNRLWLLCNAEVWYRMFIENQSRDNIRDLLLSQSYKSNPSARAA